MLSEEELRISGESVFQTVGAAEEKDRLPQQTVLTEVGGQSRRFDDERRDRVGRYSDRRSEIYVGAIPFKALKVRSAILYAIRCLTGSQ